MKGIKVLLKKKKNKNQQYVCERYKDLAEDEKQRLPECKKMIKNMGKQKCFIKL